MEPIAWLQALKLLGDMSKEGRQAQPHEGATEADYAQQEDTACNERPWSLMCGGYGDEPPFDSQFCIDNPYDSACLSQLPSQLKLSTGIKQLQINQKTVMDGLVDGFNLTFIGFGVIILIFFIYALYIRSKLANMSQIIDRINMNTLK